MQTKTKVNSSLLSPAQQKVVTTFRLTGWIAFWVELGLAVATGLVLLFAISGRNFSTKPNAALGIGIFWAICGAIALCLSVYIAFRYTRIARGLRNPNSALHPKKSDTIKFLRMAVIVSLVGIFLSLLGAGATVGVLVAKSISQPPGVAITDPERIIRALDVFVAVANINGIAGNFVGVVTSLGLFDWAHRQ
jgi:hypothetical protein